MDYPPELAKAILDQMTTQQQIKSKESLLTLVRREQEIVSARSRGEAESRLAAKEAEASIATKDAEIALIRAAGSPRRSRPRNAYFTMSLLGSEAGASGAATSGGGPVRMDWSLELLMAFRALLAVALGGFIGSERERRGREAGI